MCFYRNDSSVWWVLGVWMINWLKTQHDWCPGPDYRGSHTHMHQTPCRALTFHHKSSIPGPLNASSHIKYIFSVLVVLGSQSMMISSGNGVSHPESYVVVSQSYLWAAQTQIKSTHELLLNWALTTQFRRGASTVRCGSKIGFHRAEWTRMVHW